VRPWLFLLFAIFSLGQPLPATANDLIVIVEGVESANGEIGIALFRSADGFPLDTTHATQVWLPAKAGRVTHRISGLAAGTYAIAVSHDLNGNRKTDTNWVGIPTEPWAVSNNVRPTLRAPKFSEAAFDVIAGDAESKITIILRR